MNQAKMWVVFNTKDRMVLAMFLRGREADDYILTHEFTNYVRCDPRVLEARGETFTYLYVPDVLPVSESYSDTHKRLNSLADLVIALGGRNA